MKKILGIETTCDETAAAVVDEKRKVYSNTLASQTKLHSKYGGIVPEVASREHLKALPFIVREALETADTRIEEIDAIAISKEPGLPPALSTGYAYASGLALASNIPLIEINHLEAHISSVWLSDKGKKAQKANYPYICLLVSGGHTQIILMKKDGSSKILGQTRDDAAGEAFDKVARILNLGYPGGPVIDELAKKGDESSIKFPRPMEKSEDFDFSFSGLKTAVLREAQDHEKNRNNKGKVNKALQEFWITDMAASFQEAVVDVLVNKTIRAATEYKVDFITIAGGVSANTRLRDKMGRACNKLKLDLFYPQLKYCMDNAAMVAARAVEKTFRCYNPHIK